MVQYTKLNQQKVTDSTQVAEARSLIGRLTPQIAGHFELEIIPKVLKLDVFEIEGDGTQVILRGSSGVALASAFNRYLKDYCKCHISWCGDQLALPSPLPTVPKKVRVICLHKHRVYFNYCTLSYTASWWDWQRWEQEIDIMALNGINMPLAVVGLEGAWYHALLKFGFTDNEAREFLVGPAFFAWQWMTNIQSHGGPLPKNWIDSHIRLGQQILERQRALGMTPIQQGFSGFVPRLFKRKFPKAAIAQEGRWVGFKGTCQLDPVDPLFQEFGRTLIETEIELFGTSHVYAADPFHEGHPPQEGEDYLRQVGDQIWKLMHSVDPGAIWAMQSWSIREPIAKAAPKKRLLVLDLAGRRDDFWGYEYVKGQLHNFGGRINLHGDLNLIAENPFARTAKENDLCTGMGLFMEGIEQNPVFYEMVFDMIWRKKTVEPRSWLQDYARRRYGAKSRSADQAWNLLLDGPYQRNTNGVESSSIIAARPALHPIKSGPNAGFNMLYKANDLVKAWHLLLDDTDQLASSDAYRFDVMDVGRQVLSNHGQQLQNEVTVAFEQRDVVALETASARFIELLTDIDRLLATRNEFSFDRWVRTARSWGTNAVEKDYLEWNASMLLTIWGPHDNPLIFDYAWREWSGLIRLYYIPRWQLFFDHLKLVLKDGRRYHDPKRMTHGRHALRANRFYSKLADWEINWPQTPHKIMPKAQGDTIWIARELASKWVK